MATSQPSAAGPVNDPGGHGHASAWHARRRTTRGGPVADLDYLAVHAAAQPDEMAVVDGDWVLTRATFNALVNRYGNVLRSVGVAAGEKVLWVGQNSAEVVAVNHAARKVGAVCVPMNYRLAPDEAQYVIDNCDA